jgi:hypothetical protein
LSRPYQPTNASSQALTEVTRELSGSERLIWTGQPVRGVRLQAGDALLIPFSLVWGGFAFFWEGTVLTRGAPLFFALWGVPFVLVGIYITVGRFFFDAWRRSRTVYALTSERVLILSGGFSRTVTSLRLAAIPSVSLKEARSGVGTISFGGGSPMAAWFGGMQGWPGSDRYLGPRFELLPKARSVYESIQAAQRSPI